MHRFAWSKGRRMRRRYMSWEAKQIVIEEVDMEENTEH